MSRVNGFKGFNESEKLPSGNGKKNALAGCVVVSTLSLSVWSLKLSQHTVLEFVEQWCFKLAVAQCALSFLTANLLTVLVSTMCLQLVASHALSCLVLSFLDLLSTLCCCVTARFAYIQSFDQHVLFTDTSGMTTTSQC